MKHPSSVFSFMPLVALLPFAALVAGCSDKLVVNESAAVVHPVVETTPVESSDDAADDPAIWINSTNASSSLILGTDKQSGLAVYDLNGELVQFLEAGRLNNVDLRQGLMIDGIEISLAAATNRTTNNIDIFSISSRGDVRFESSQALDFAEPYGICMFKTASGDAHAFVNDKSGSYQQWLLNRDGQINPVLLGNFAVETQPEGCVVHDATETLYLGEEERGLWMMPADNRRATEMQLIDRVDSENLTADVEGMDIYLGADGKDWLIVSSQGDNSYAAYDLSVDTPAFIGSFRVADNTELGIDGSEETDGLAVTAVNLGGEFSSGMLVVQDGFNKLPKENQNFKYISWAQIQDQLLQD